MTTLRPFVVSCCACALAALAVAKTDTQTAPASAASRLIGTWSLVSYESSDTESQQFRGPKPIGLIYYDRTGHMAVQIAPDRDEAHAGCRVEEPSVATNEDRPSGADRGGQPQISRHVDAPARDHFRRTGDGE